MSRIEGWKQAVWAVALMAAMTAAGAALPLQPDTRLPEAVKRGDQAAAQALLRAHVPVDSAEGDGSTALHWAAYENNLELARMLLDAHADVSAKTRLEAMTPLFMACENGNAAMIDLLLSHGAQANGANALGTTPLMMAAASGSADAVRVLLEHGAAVNARESVRNQTALMFAANYNRAEAIKLLIAHGADPNLQSKVEAPYRLPFHTLANNYKKPAGADAKGAAGAILKNAESSADGAGSRPSAAGNAEAEATNRESASPEDAKRKPDSEYVRGAKLVGGMSPLLYAARQGNLEAASALLEGGANVNEPSGSEHTTALVLAIANGHYDLARLLLEHGADANLANEQGLTPLYAAVDVRWAQHEWSAEPLVTQEKTDYLELMHLLIAHGADVNARLRIVVWERMLSQNQVWINLSGSTAFFRAAQADDVQAMSLLKNAGADPGIPTTDGVTPLMAAAGLGWAANYSSTAPDRLAAVKYCRSLGADVNQADELGYTALGGAAFVGDLDVIRYLVAQGADLKAKTKAGDTVADLANGLFEKSLPQPQAVALLMSMGVPEPHNCRSSECLPVTNAQVRAAERPH